MVKIIEMFIPKSNTKTRPGRKMTPTSITIHETDNTNVRANALAHARLQANGNPRTASWHLQVDDEPEVYQSIPFNEVSLHAGNATGNNTSISLEICVNKDGNYKTAVANAIKVVKYLLKLYPSIKAVNVVQHHKWSGKNCPRHLRAGDWGINWSKFIAGVKGASVAATKPATPPKYTTTNTNYKIGETVRVKKTAKTFATGQTIASFVKGNTYKILQRGSNRLLLDGIMSWVKTSDIEKVSGTMNKTTSSPKQSNTTTATIKVGTAVRIKKSAKVYVTGEPIPSSIHGKHDIVRQVKGKQVLLKGIYSWVYKKDVEIVSGNTTKKATSTKKYTPKSYRVGSKVKIKSSAKTYSRSTAAIPARYKNKSYTIQQASKDDVLIKELYSWVRKSDLT